MFKVAFDLEFKMGMERGQNRNGTRTESIRYISFYTHLVEDGSGVHLERIGEYVQLPSVSHSHDYVPDPT